MPDDRVKISALDSASTVETGDMFPVTQERNGVKKTNKAFMSQIASEVVNGIEYTTALNTDDKKPIGAINELLDRIYDMFPVKSFSATPLATLPDSANGVPMKSLSVNIVPKETGTGTKSPSNPYTISGWTEANVLHSGKNICGGTQLLANAQSYISGTTDLEEKTFRFSSGTTPDNTTSFCGGLTGKFKENTAYTIILAMKGSGDTPRSNMRIYYSDGTYTGVTNPTTSKTTIVMTTNAEKTFSALRKYTGSGNTTLYYDECGIFEGTVTADDFEPYSATTHTISLGQTVYGGVCDVTGGQSENVNATPVAINTLNWAYDSTNSRFTTEDIKNIVKRPANNNTPLDGLACEVYQLDVASSARQVNLSIAVSSNGTLVIKDTDYTDTATWLTAIGSYKICYPLATPTTLSTTPTAIKTTGYDNVSADCGDVEGEYRCDIQKYIDGLVNNGNRSVPNLSKGGNTEEEPKKEKEEPEKEEQEEKK